MVEFTPKKFKQLPTHEVSYVDIDYTKYRPINLKKDFTLKINGAKWKAAPHCSYKFDYAKIVERIRKNEIPELESFRYLLRNDLWFLLYFGLGVSVANHPFVVEKCREVEDGPVTDTLDVWSRDHFKSTIITIGENIQEILRNPETTILILSYNKRLAQSFFGIIRNHLESNEFLKQCFPDILPEDVKELGKGQWTDDGINVIRKRVTKEFSVAAAGLIDGMPTGFHYDKLNYDDISTLDLSKNPKTMDDVKETFSMSANLGTEGTRRRVVGTFYHYQDVLCHIRDLKNVDGELAFTSRIVPATIDGTYAGDGVLLSKARLNQLRTEPKTFSMQNLCNPMPTEMRSLEYQMLRPIAKEDLPKKMFKFMVVDPARGDRADGRDQDRWAILVAGVDPYLTDLGASKVYLLDGVIERMSINDAMKQIVQLYMRNGWIHKLGVEQVGASTMEIHVQNALKAKGRIVTIENRMMHILKPRGRKKEKRIEENISPPLNTGLVYVCDSLPMGVRVELEAEMERFPYYKDDGLDAMSYIWDLINEYHLPIHQVESPEDKKEQERLERGDRWDRAFREARKRNRTRLDWMAR